MVWRRVILSALAAITAFGFLWWRCRSDPEIIFLGHHGGAEWIVFPYAVDSLAHRGLSLDATFRAGITLDSPPTRSRCVVRAARRFELKINGAAIPVNSARNWKSPTTVETAKYLRSGWNSIEVRVFNDTGPPGLWCALSADQKQLQTGAGWEASFVGSSWRNAVLASDGRFPGAGNPVGGGEQTIDALKSIWPYWVAFALTGAGVVMAGNAAMGRWRKQNRISPVPIAVILLGGTSLLWVILFWRNIAALPLIEGFDAVDHFNYIKYVREHWSLPAPWEGLEMFQAPLYYVLSATVLSVFRLTNDGFAAIVALRAITMACGVASFIFVFLTVRELCPHRIDAQAAALGFSAFLPMNLYLCHFVTNETMAATLTSAVIYTAVRMLRRDEPSTIILVVLGLLLGAAILTKVTPILLIPPLALGILLKEWRNHSRVGQWIRHFSIPFGVCIAVASWNFVRTARLVGKPFVGGWETASGFFWWQDPGYRTGADYLRFGRSLVQPLFSGFAGFADAIYSTCWGDGLCAGKSALLYRLPWNYPFMTGGYLLALIPVILVAIGALVVTYHWLKRGSPEVAMLLSFSILTGLALIQMSLRTPSYIQKSFWGLSLLVPLGYFAATGWIMLTRSGRLTRLAVGGALAAWAINSFISFWVPESAGRYVYLGVALPADRTNDVLTALNQAIKIDPENWQAWLVRGSFEARSGDLEKALQTNQRTVELAPTSGLAHTQRALLLHQKNRFAEATGEAQRAISLGPEDPDTPPLLADCLWRGHRIEEASNVAHDGLVVAPLSADLHRIAGFTALTHQDFTTAANQFSYTLMLDPHGNPADSKMLRSIFVAVGQEPNHQEMLIELAAQLPDSADGLAFLAWLLATSPDDGVRNGPVAVQLAERACKFTKNNNALNLATLAAAYAEVGRFQEARDKCSAAEAIAAERHDEVVQELTKQLIAQFSQDQAFRDLH